MRSYMCSSYTVSGVMPGDVTPSRHGFGHRIAACERAGYEGYWMHWRDYAALVASGVSDARIAEIVAACGMSRFGVEFLTDWVESEEQGEAECLAFAAARAIGADVLSVGGDFLDRGLSRDEMRVRFAALCLRAQQENLRVALEFVPFSNVAGIAGALDLVGDHANAGLVVDCWHLFRGGIALDDLSQIPADRILAVQVNDATARPCHPLPVDTLHRLPCGMGAFDLAGFARVLDGLGVSVPLSVEIISPDFAEMPVDQAARESIGAARAVFDG